MARGVLRMSAGVTVFASPPMRGATFAPHTARCLLSPATVRLAGSSNVFSDAQLKYMHATQTSKDPRDVVWHRALTEQINPDGTERGTNNSIMHAMDIPMGPRKQWNCMFNRKR
jgi:hypothetical protein